MSCLRRGQASDDPRLTEAAVELAEHYQRPGVLRLVPYFGLATVVLVTLIAVIYAIDGDWGPAVVGACILSGRLLFFRSVPLIWAGNVGRSLDASRKAPRTPSRSVGLLGNDGLDWLPLCARSGGVLVQEPPHQLAFPGWTVRDGSISTDLSNSDFSGSIIQYSGPATLTSGKPSSARRDSIKPLHE